MNGKQHRVGSNRSKRSWTLNPSSTRNANAWKSGSGTEEADGVHRADLEKAPRVVRLVVMMLPERHM